MCSIRKKGNQIKRIFGDKKNAMLLVFLIFLIVSIFSFGMQTTVPGTQKSGKNRPAIESYVYKETEQQLMDMLRKHQNNIRTIDEELLRKRQLVESDEKRLQELSNASRARQSSIESKTAVSEQLGAQIEQLTQQRQELQANVHTIDQQLQQVVAQKYTEQKDLDEIHNQYETKRKSLTDKIALSQEWSEYLKQLNTSAQEAAQQQQQENQRLNALQAERTKLDQENQQRRNSLERMNGEREQLQQSIQQLAHEHKQLEEQKRKIDADLNQSVLALKDSQSLAEKLADDQKHMERLGIAMFNLRKYNAKSAENSKEFKKQLEALNANISATQMSLSVAETALEIAKDDYHKYKKKQQKIQAQISQNESDLTRVQQLLEDKRQELSEVNHLVNDSKHNEPQIRERRKPQPNAIPIVTDIESQEKTRASMPQKSTSTRWWPWLWPFGSTKTS